MALNLLNKQIFLLTAFSFKFCVNNSGIIISPRIAVVLLDVDVVRFNHRFQTLSKAAHLEGFLLDPNIS